MAACFAAVQPDSAAFVNGRAVHAQCSASSFRTRLLAQARNPYSRSWLWIPGSCFARPGMTFSASLRAKRSNPALRETKWIAPRDQVDCFVAIAPRNDEPNGPSQARRANQHLACLALVAKIF